MRFRWVERPGAYQRYLWTCRKVANFEAGCRNSGGLRLLRLEILPDHCRTVLFLLCFLLFLDCPFFLLLFLYRSILLLFSSSSYAFTLSLGLLHFLRHFLRCWRSRTLR